MHTRVLASWGCVESLLVETFLGQDEIQGQLPLQLPQQLQLQLQLNLHYTNNYTYNYSCRYSYSDELLILTARQTRRPPTMGSGRRNLTSRVSQKGGGDTVHWPTGVHQEGGYTRWNGYCLMRGLVGQDKRLFHACAREGAHTCARACAPALARACSRLRARVCAYGRGRLQGHDIAGAK